MSYDLFFLRRRDAPALTEESFLEYFLSRPWYEGGDDQYYYQNNDTGVYFCFDFINDPEDAMEDESDDLVSARLSFNLNYFRPHIFGLEAEPEVTAFVEHFSLMVDDPQISGMGRGEYSRDGFLNGWNTGNLTAHRIIPSQMEGEQEIHSLPAAELERHWRWNLGRQRLQSDLGDNAYVALVQFLNIGGKACTFSTWSEGIPQAIPKTDYVMLYRHQINPRSWLFRRRRDLSLVPFSALSGLLKFAKARDEPCPHFHFDYTETPQEIVDFFRAQPRLTKKHSGITWDSVLTQEVLDEARSLEGGAS